jgi:hypothetical protein
MIAATLVLLHTEAMDVVYFWSAVLIAAIPVGVFATIGVLVVRGYFRRRVPDGGGAPPAATGTGRRWRVVPAGGEIDDGSRDRDPPRA